MPSRRRLSELLAAIAIAWDPAQEDPWIEAVSADSRQVPQGGLFVALKGALHDGHAYVENAWSMGAAAVVVQQGCDYSREDARGPFVEVPDSRQALALLSAALYGPLQPPLVDQIVGITGTNGKTTSTYLLEAILAQAGHLPGVLGTISYRVGAQLFPAPLTTPSPEILWQNLLRMQQVGASHLLMEVSSHALDQYRIDGLSFQVAGFTNLSQDHLDYHKTMEEYLQAKLRLFSALVKPTGRAVVNLDDPVAARIQEVSRAPVWTYSQVPGKGADIQVLQTDISIEGIQASLQTPMGTFSIQSPMLGAFNLSNLLLACGISLALGVSIEDIQQGVRLMPAVPGRMEVVQHPLDFQIVVDYAHTPDALAQVLACLKPLCRGRLLVVFGCGGDRDRAKRPLMGQVVAETADVCIVTSDNPRTEAPDTIIQDICAGIVSSHRLLSEEDLAAGERGFLTCLDRGKAIQKAVAIAQSDDVVLIAGKGHETYQVVGTVRYPFDDRIKARDAVQVRIASTQTEHPQEPPTAQQDPFDEQVDGVTVATETKAGDVS